MAVSYKRLWKLLVDKEMSKSDLRKKAEIAPNTMTKLRRDEEVSLTILSKICKTLNADFGDIVEYVPDAEIWDLYDENRGLIGRDHVNRKGKVEIFGIGAGGGKWKPITREEMIDVIETLAWRVAVAENSRTSIIDSEMVRRVLEEEGIKLKDEQ